MSYFCRLATFASCPTLPARCSVSCMTLAKCGFFYAGQSDHLVCQRCGDQFSGWLETHRNPTVEHCCASPSTITEGIPVREVYRDHHNSTSTIYSIFITVLQRAARNGVLRPAETRDLIPSDQPGHTSMLCPTTPESDHNSNHTGQGATESDDDDDVTVTSDGSDETNVLKLKLSWAKHHSSPVHYCPWCVWRWWW